MYWDKLPPHDLDAELAVLGSCFIDFKAIFKIADFLKPSDFYREKNQWVFAAMLKLRKEGRPTNQIIVAHELAKEGKLKALGGADYINESVRVTPTSVHVKYYAEIVKDCSERRLKLHKASQLTVEAYDRKPTKRLKVIDI